MGDGGGVTWRSAGKEMAGSVTWQGRTTVGRKIWREEEYPLYGDRALWTLQRISHI